MSVKTKCPNCKGSGKVSFMRPIEVMGSLGIDHFERTSQKCQCCKGSGKITDEIK